MLILHVSMSPFASTYGGLEIYLQQIVEAQVALGHEVCVLSIYYKGDDWHWQEISRQGRLLVMELHIPEENSKMDFSRCLPKLREMLFEFLSGWRPDICHGHHGFAHEVIGLCHELGIPCIYTAHCGEPFCANGMLFRPRKGPCDGNGSFRKCLYCRTSYYRFGTFTRFLACCLPKRVRRWFEKKIDHWPFVYFITPIFSETRYLARLQHEISLLSFSQYVIAPSKAVATVAKQNGLKTELSVLPHQVPSSVAYLPYPSIENADIHFYYVGRVCVYKGLHVLLKACGMLSHSNWHLHIIGGTERNGEDKYLQKLQREYGDSRISWYGKIPYSLLPKLIQNLHAMIHPALWLESFGLTVAEALAMGRPVLTTACGGPEEQVTIGKTGWVVAKDDARALANQMDEILSHPEQLLAMHEQCRQTVKEDYVSSLMKVYQQAISKLG